MDRDLEGQSSGYDMTSLQTVPCHTAGMLELILLKEKIVSNSLIIWQDMWDKDFIYIALVCKVLVGFVALRPKSTAMVIAGRSVHLTTLFPGQA